MCDEWHELSWRWLARRSAGTVKRTSDGVGGVDDLEDAHVAASEGEQTHESQAHFRLARALVAAGDDRVPPSARDGLRRSGQARQLAEAESWLAAERGRRR